MEERKGEEITVHNINFSRLREIHRDPAVSRSAKVILVDLLLYAGVDGVSYPSRETLGKNHNLSPRQIETLITELRDKGLVSWIRGGERRSNSYSFDKELYFPITDQSGKYTSLSVSPQTTQTGSTLHTKGINTNSREEKQNLWELRQLRVQAAKRDCPILDVAQRLALINSFTPGNITRAGCYNKTAHKNGDRNPSLNLMPDANRYECKGCPEKGDVIDLVQKVKNIGFNEAMEWLDPGFSQLRSASTKIDPATYLQNRKITEETARKFGLRMQKGCVVIPLPNGGEKYRWIYRTENKYTFKKGTKHCLYKTSDPINNVVFIVEGELDAVLLHQETQQAVWTTTGGVETFYKSWLPDFDSLTKIYICYDNDEAGKRGALRAAQTLGTSRCFDISLPTGIKDITEYFQNGHSKEEFVQLVTQALPFPADQEGSYTQDLHFAHAPVRLG